MPPISNAISRNCVVGYTVDFVQRNGVTNTPLSKPRSYSNHRLPLKCPHQAMHVVWIAVIVSWVSRIGRRALMFLLHTCTKTANFFVDGTKERSWHCVTTVDMALRGTFKDVFAVNSSRRRAHTSATRRWHGHAAKRKKHACPISPPTIFCLQRHIECRSYAWRYCANPHACPWRDSTPSALPSHSWTKLRLPVVHLWFIAIAWIRWIPSLCT